MMYGPCIGFTALLNGCASSAHCSKALIPKPRARNPETLRPYNLNLYVNPEPKSLNPDP